MTCDVKRARGFVLAYYLAQLLIVLFLFASILRKVTYSAFEFLSWFILAALIAGSVLTAWYVYASRLK